MFDIIGVVQQIETIAAARGIRRLRYLTRRYGSGNWLKRKGIAKIRLEDGTVGTAEIHWYEAAGIGRKDFKIKHMLD